MSSQFLTSAVTSHFFLYLTLLPTLAYQLPRLFKILLGYDPDYFTSFNIMTVLGKEKNLQLLYICVCVHAHTCRHGWGVGVGLCIYLLINFHLSKLPP